MAMEVDCAQPLSIISLVILPAPLVKFMLNFSWQSFLWLVRWNFGMTTRKYERDDKLKDDDTG